MQSQERVVPLCPRIKIRKQRNSNNVVHQKIKKEQFAFDSAFLAK